MGNLSDWRPVSLLFLLVVLLFGCVQQAPGEPETANSTIAADRNDVKKANETGQAIDEEVKVSVFSFSSNKKTYGSNEQMAISLLLESSKRVENVRVRVFGIKPYGHAYVDRTEHVNLSVGKNEITMTAETPYCTAGCGGVYPGPYDIYVNVFIGDVLAANARTTITLIDR